MRKVLNCLLYLVGGVIAGYLLLVLCFCLPNGRIHNNVIESGKSFNGEYKTLIRNNIATKTDDYTDALMLLTAENNDDKNPLTASIYAYHTVRSGDYPNKTITDLENSNNEAEQYSRYWHGYLFFLKPLLLFFNYDQILVVNAFVVLALIIGVVYLLQKRRLSKYIIPYTIAIGLMFPVAISLSMQYFTVFAVFNVAVILELLFFEKIQRTHNFFYWFLLIGMVVCYFDLLTYPLVSLGIPLLIWLLMENYKKVLSLKKNLGRIVLGALAWGIGYFGIWVGKWVLGSIVTGENLFASAMDAAEHRTMSAIDSSEQISRTFPITEAFGKIFTMPVCFVLILVLVVGIVLIIKRRIQINRKKALANLWMLAIALLPLVWYMVLANHSAWHMFFTYRTMCILVFAIGCYLISLLEKTKCI